MRGSGEVCKGVSVEEVAEGWVWKGSDEAGYQMDLQVHSPNPAWPESGGEHDNGITGTVERTLWFELTGYVCGGWMVGGT